MKALLLTATAILAALANTSCDMMLESGDSGYYDPSLDYGGYGLGPWYSGFGSGGWNLGLNPPYTAPPVVGPINPAPHPPGRPARPAVGPSLTPTTQPVQQPASGQRPGAGNQPAVLPGNTQLPDLNITGGEPGPAIQQTPSSGQRPGAQGRH